MTVSSLSVSSKPSRAMRRLALPLLAATLLAACAPTFEARVSRFTALPVPAAKSFYIAPADAANAGGLEFGTYANLVKQQLVANGFTEVGSAEGSDVTVLLDYSVGAPQQRIQSRPGGFGGWGGGWGGGFGGWGGGFGGLGGFGWNPYWGGWGGGLGGWGGGWGGSEIYSVTEYTSVVAVKMVRTADKQSLFEGRADTTSRSRNLPALMPNLVRAMFTNFPGTNGQAVRVRFNPTDTAAAPRVTPLR